MHRIHIFVKILLIFVITSSYFSRLLLAEEEAEGFKTNLGTRINSKYAESNPVISPDGKTLFFSRKHHPDNIGGINDPDDIWFSTLEGESTWTEAVNIGSPLNNEASNFVCSVTPDGNTLLLANVYHKDGSMGPGVSLSHRTASGWSFPEPLNIDGFYNLSNYVSYYLANDGKTLMLAIQQNDGYGDLDIYVSFFKEENTWSAPQNLGYSINTPRREGTPFLASDRVSLYFSSNGHGGYGNRDIFVSRRMGSGWTRWTKPQNLGSAVNTKLTDIYYKIPAKGDFAYFVSKDNSYGESDIFRSPAPEGASPMPVIMISGNVLDKKTKDPLEAKIIYETLPEGNEAGIARSNPGDGKYKIVLPAGTLYGFRAEAIKPGYYGINDNIDATDLQEYTEIMRDLYLIAMVKEDTIAIRINNVFFDFDDYQLLPESYPELTRLSEILKENPGQKVEISGHTDNKGSTEYNYNLSLKRAQAVVNYLSSKGVDAEKLVFKGYGETRPIVGNDSEVERAQNRRVEFRFID